MAGDLLILVGGNSERWFAHKNSLLIQKDAVRQQFAGAIGRGLGGGAPETALPVRYFSWTGAPEREDTWIDYGGVANAAAGFAGGFLVGNVTFSLGGAIAAGTAAAVTAHSRWVSKCDDRIIAELNSLGELSGPQNIHIIGWSNGGDTAYQLARTLSQSGQLQSTVQTLITLDPVSRFSDVRQATPFDKSMPKPGAGVYWINCSQMEPKPLLTTGDPSSVGGHWGWQKNADKNLQRPGWKHGSTGGMLGLAVDHLKSLKR
ncbi:MAG: hypothetical protein AAF511_02865 [Pseudomonadota bacterium]